MDFSAGTRSLDSFIWSSVYISSHVLSLLLFAVSVPRMISFASIPSFPLIQFVLIFEAQL